MGKRLFFLLGTNNWQCEGEFAPGSGILHESHHAAYNRMQETRVIGADSGGPKDFVTQETGALVPESSDLEIFVESLTRTVREALAEDWKHTKGPEAFRYASSNFSIDSQCQDIIDAVLKNTLD